MYYLIDYENVASNGFIGIEALTNDDKVIIFYSESNCKLPFSLHKQINESAAQFEYMDIKTTGKNSLDFQLSTYLGYIIAKESNKEFTVISNDEGFNAIIKFWKSRNIRINRCKNLSRQTNESIKEQLKTLLKQYPEDINKVFDILNKYKTKQGINNALLKELGNEKTGVIYKVIKPLLKDKKGN